MNQSHIKLDEETVIHFMCYTCKRMHSTKVNFFPNGQTTPTNLLNQILALNKGDYINIKHNGTSILINL